MGIRPLVVKLEIRWSRTQLPKATVEGGTQGEGIKEVRVEYASLDHVKLSLGLGSFMLSVFLNLVEVGVESTWLVSFCFTLRAGNPNINSYYVKLSIEAGQKSFCLMMEKVTLTTWAKIFVLLIIGNTVPLKSLHLIAMTNHAHPRNDRMVTTHIAVYQQ